MNCRCIPGINDDESSNKLNMFISKIPNKSYIIHENELCDNKKILNFQLINQNVVEYPWLHVNTFKIENIPLLYIQNKNSVVNGITILYSHGIHTDIGLSYGFLLDLATILKCNVISYDYNINLKSIKRNISLLEECLFESIEIVMEYIIQTLQINPKHLILMSHSFGSIPTTYISSFDEYKELLGLIFISPLIRISFHLNNKNSIEPKHPIDESNRVEQYFSNILCNVFIIHGKNDEIVNYSNSKKMSSYIKHCETFFPHDTGHVDIFLGKQRILIYSKLLKFLDILPIANKRKLTLYQIQSKQRTLSKNTNIQNVSECKYTDDKNQSNSINSNELRIDIGNMCSSIEKNFVI